MIHDYKKLIIWQKAVELVVEIYRLTTLFPVDEKFGLVSQMKRAAVSIASNIAEGCMRGSSKEYKQFLLTSFSSGAELETQIIIAKKINFVRLHEYKLTDSLLLEIMKMLNKSISTLSANI